MPSPIGHALAGLGVSFAADGRRRSTRWTLWFGVACALLAAAPDLDLLVAGAHRTWTHSLVAVSAVGAVSAAITRLLVGRTLWSVVIGCAGAWASHLALDYVGADPGIPAGIALLWPFDRTYFIAPLELFRATERHDPFSAYAIGMNLRALVQELAVVGPLVVLAWLRRRRHARLTDSRAASADAA